jgi:radical SAM superfamily enzyme with C-terminal helix-hairpin-helix motif
MHALAKHRGTLPTVLDKLYMVANINIRKLIETIKTELNKRSKNSSIIRND